MGILDTVSEIFEASAQRAPSETGDGSEGSYWCDDCAVRVRDIEVESEGLDRGEDGTPICPDCSGSMRFERASGTGCAC